MSQKTKNNRIGLILALVGILLGIALSGLQYKGLKTKTVERKIQKKLLKIDQDMQSIIDQDLDRNLIKKNEVGLFVFSTDTLTYWNNNLISPKILKRRIIVGHDTICTMPSGDYLIKSITKGNYNYYLFKEINTHYKIENQYFKSNFTPFNKLLDIQLEFQPDSGSFEIRNTEGKLLSKSSIIGQTKLKSPYKYWMYPVAAMILIGAVMALSKPRKPKPREKNTNSTLEIGIGIMVVLALTGTYVYDKIEARNENERMQKTAETLREKRDENFENAFEQFAETLSADTYLREMLFAESNVLADVVLGYTKELLFDENMKAYNTTLTLCESEEEITIQPEGYVTNCDDYFLEKLANNKQKRVKNGLYLIDYYTLDPNYLGKLSIKSPDSLRQKNLYFEFYKPIAPEGFGFPQLLQEDRHKGANDYSVANYSDNVLVYKYGRYIYPNFLNDLQGKDRGFNYKQGFKHYTIKNGENNAIVISTQRKGWSELTAPFAVFFSILLIPYLLIIWLIRPKEDKKSRSLRQRMQSVVLYTLAISFIAIGPVSVIYMRSVYNQKTITSQFETTRTLSIEMANHLDLASMIGETSSDTWTEILQQYSNAFFTDLNLYNLNGTLIATTRPEINELNLQAALMNAEAYQQMHRNKALYYTHEEHLGKGKYESAYIPLTDGGGNTLAYLNTPYFSSATELHKEIQNFVLTYINIILILLGMALAFILSITKRLTQPLALIQSKMGKIKIDQKNELIEWHRDDEIGALIKQYNKLIIELEKSAAELRRTSAESAWRGVARQVAHEIKNSLTPMRLSVQMLQRSMQKGDANLEEKMRRTSATLIEQIDALSDIATSFSRYAKLPENHPQPLDLAEVIGNVVNLYDNVENITFSYIYDTKTDHNYNGDKTNLNSAIGNIIKNATQAIGTKPDGQIEVNLVAKENRFVITVADNGKGIREEDKDKVFLPNFTTKSGGSGVGLSLAYNIIQTHGGNIAFESIVNVGTKFTVELPKNAADTLQK